MQDHFRQNKHVHQLNKPNNITSNCSRTTKDNSVVEQIVDGTSTDINSETNSNKNNTIVNLTKDTIVDHIKNDNKICQPTTTPLDVIEVQHECFGKAWGQLNSKLYVSPDSKCITCTECCKYYVNNDILNMFVCIFIIV